MATKESDVDRGPGRENICVLQQRSGEHAARMFESDAYACLFQQGIPKVIQGMLSLNIARISFSCTWLSCDFLNVHNSRKVSTSNRQITPR
jgi:hypothetical protein